MSTLPSPLSLLQERSTSPRPLLVDVSGPTSRVELSGRVLGNWWAKNVGLLETEFSLSPGDLVVFTAAATWRTLPLALAALTLGAEVVEDEEASAEADLLVADTLDDAALQAPEILAVATAPLALDFGEPLPAGVVDHAAEVRSQPDQPQFDPSAAGQARWRTTDAAGDLSALQEAVASRTGERVASVPRARGVVDAVVQVLAAGADGHVLLHDGEVPDAATAAQEGVTGASRPLA